MEFDSVADRDYYALKDPAHLEFANTLKDVVDDLRVVDYAPRVF